MAIRPLPAQLAKKAQDELYEKPSEIEKHIKELRHWILEQPHLKARTGRCFATFDIENSIQSFS